jgi:hypothetical protein
MIDVATAVSDLNACITTCGAGRGASCSRNCKVIFVWFNRALCCRAFCSSPNRPVGGPCLQASAPLSIWLLAPTSCQLQCSELVIHFSTSFSCTCDLCFSVLQLSTCSPTNTVIAAHLNQHYDGKGAQQPSPTYREGGSGAAELSSQTHSRRTSNTLGPSQLLCCTAHWLGVVYSR